MAKNTEKGSVIARGTVLAAGYMVAQPHPRYFTVIGKDGEANPVKVYACKKVSSVAQIDDKGLHTIYLTEDGQNRLVSTSDKGVFKIEPVATTGIGKNEGAVVLIFSPNNVEKIRELVEKNSKLFVKAGIRGRGGSIDEYWIGQAD